jgi:hypothetical protein
VKIKSKILILLSLFLLLVLGLQCKKEKGPETVETWGYIIDEVTRKPIDGAKVLFFNSLTPSSSALYSKVVDSTYTDSTGFFRKKWINTRDWTQMTYRKSGYYQYLDLRTIATKAMLIH